MTPTSATATAALGSAETGVVGLGHVVLYVADLQRSLRPYRAVLGRPVVMQPDTVALAGFSAGTPRHDLLLIEVGPDATAIPTGRRVGLYNFGVTDDDDRHLETVLEGHAANPGIGALVGAADHTLTHCPYLHDPDGNEVEAYTDVAGLDWTDPTLLMQPPRRLELAARHQHRSGAR